MANITYEQAVARKLIPDIPGIQADILDQLGGQKNVFKSEEFFNQAIDKIIKEGYRSQEKALEFFNPATGQYELGTRQTRGYMEVASNPNYDKTYLTDQLPGQHSGYVFYNAPKGIEPTSYTGIGINKKPVYDMRVVDVFRPEGVGSATTYLDADQLKQLKKLAKSGTQDVKRETATMTSSRKRLSRATGGLAAKARPIGESGGTGLPELGTGGLQVGQTSLGKGLLV